MGHRISVHGAGTEFRRPGCLSVLLGHHRSTLLPRRNIHVVNLLHAEGSCYAYRLAVLRANSGNWFQWIDCSRCFRNGWRTRTCWVAVALHHVGLDLSVSLKCMLTCASEGAATALVAIFGFFMLPNTPLTTRWLTPPERELAHARMERDRVGDSMEPVSMMEGLRQACRDKRTWLFCLMQNFHLSACSFNSFFPT